MESLRKHFSGVAAKYLSRVDATARSNQHEIGSNSFTQILGNPGADKVLLEGSFLYLSDELEEPLRATGILTWYDTRLKQAHRSAEYRLYYRENSVTAQMTEGDFCVIAVREDGSLLVVITPPNSTSEQQIRWLFDIADIPKQGFEVHPVTNNRSVSIAEAAILEELGIEARLDDESWLDRIEAKFGTTFPATAQFSAWARECCPDTPSAIDDPDGALMAWIKHEEMLFRTLERHTVEQVLAKGFEDVDHFVQFSLSVQNRRKSRVGYALEHHLKAIFESCKLKYAWQAVTENRSKVDFLFPTTNAYHDPQWPENKLLMLASKSTCKDRWRQVLAEASRIHRKHLLTLEPAISTHQTDEMEAHKLQLVVPHEISRTYTAKQQSWLLDLKQYIELVRLNTQ